VKKYLPLLAGLCCIIFSLPLSSCKKGITNPINLDKAAGKWSINAVRYRLHVGLSNYQDSTAPWNPSPENFVSFDGKSTLQYQFNTARIFNGTYKFIREDSIVMNVDGETSRWKILLLTPNNFNIEMTSEYLHDFPGRKVTIYQSFVR